MGSMSIWHWLILLVIVMLLFGAGKVPKLMGDMAKGVKAFKEGLKEANEDSAKPQQPAPAAQVTPPESKRDTASV
ncbi:MAG TPA: twin-arginine translocase TatA/TatE family subunit [Alphaproteobacteria bacterium]|nr:twin-arginine translocase TatA/TatE family subunit [Alphaproteobacteria bacterium]